MCPTKKRQYLNITLAEDALIEAWIKFSYLPGSGPVAIYKCEDCGQYHFTSKGLMNEKLAEKLNNGEIKKQKEANDWLNKLNRK